MAGRHKGDHSSLMWCLWLERQVCPRLGGQEGLSAHPGPKSVPSSFEAAVALWPELLTPAPPSSLHPAPQVLQDPKRGHGGAEQEDSWVPLQTSFLGFVTHQPNLLSVTHGSISLCWSSIAPPLNNEEDNGLAACPTPKEQPDPSLHSIFGPASMFSCNEHPLADNRSHCSGCSCVPAGGVTVALSRSACKGEDS